MKTQIVLAALALAGALGFAATNPQQGVEVQMILTSADHMTHQPPVLKPADVTILDATITDWLPLTGRDLELFVLIDDSANYDLGPKLQDLRQFITIQPDPASIGVAYIHEGVLQVAENPTTDHRLAAQALRAPSGSKAANPYCALSDLIRGWPKSDGWPKRTLRREILIVTSAVDDSAGGGPVCVNAETAIRDAERAGVVVYALYNPASNYLSQDWSKLDAGQVSLASLSYETGGEAYFVGHTPPLSFEPFLTDIEEHLAHQYLVTIRVTPVAEGAFQTIFVTSGTPDRELMKPEKIWVPAAR